MRSLAERNYAYPPTGASSTLMALAVASNIRSAATPDDWSVFFTVHGSSLYGWPDNGNPRSYRSAAAARTAAERWLADMEAGKC